MEVPPYRPSRTPRDFHDHEEHRAFQATFGSMGLEAAAACVSTASGLTRSRTRLGGIAPSQAKAGAGCEQAAPAPFCAWRTTSPYPANARRDLALVPGGGAQAKALPGPVSPMKCAGERVGRRPPRQARQDDSPVVRHRGNRCRGRPRSTPGPPLAAKWWGDSARHRRRRPEHGLARCVTFALVVNRRRRRNPDRLCPIWAHVALENRRLRPAARPRPRGRSWPGVPRRAGRVVAISWLSLAAMSEGCRRPMMASQLSPSEQDAAFDERSARRAWRRLWRGDAQRAHLA